MKKALFAFVGLSIPFAIRTTILTDTIRNVPLHFLTTYLYAVDIAMVSLVILMIYRYGKNIFREIPSWFLGVVVAGVWTTLMSDYPLMTFLSVVRVLVYSFVFWQALIHRYSILIWQGFSIGMIFQALWVSIQAVRQSSLGGSVVVEPVLNASLAGVAKAEILGSTILRISGTFPHPNVLGYAAFLMLWGIVFETISRQHQWVWNLFLAGAFVFVAQIDHYFITSVQGMLLAGLSVISLRLNPIQKTFRLTDSIVAWAMIGVLLLTFSKTAITLVLIGSFILLTMKLFPRMFHVEHFKSINRQWLIQGLLVISTASLWGIIILGFLPTAVKRVFYIRQAILQLIESHGLGVGLGRSVAYLPENLAFWQYQPVHSVPLLILSEVGIGLLIGGSVWIMSNYLYNYGK